MLNACKLKDKPFYIAMVFTLLFASGFGYAQNNNPVQSNGAELGKVTGIGGWFIRANDQASSSV